MTMNPEPFASGSLSLALAWIAGVPTILALVGGAIGVLFEHGDETVPRWFVFWIMLSVLVFSPFRYMALQLLIGASYVVQSGRAFLTTFLLALYIPIVYGLFFFVGVGLPLLITAKAAFRNLDAPVVSKGRLMLGSVLAPFAMGLGYLAFFWLLPYGAMSTHWLRPADVIGATNGPALGVYSVALKHAMPLPVREFYIEVSGTDFEMLRNHVASYYLGTEAEAEYVKTAYPELYQRLTRR